MTFKPLSWPAFALACALLVAGCATPRVEYREVKVPVPIQCKPEQVSEPEEYPFDTLPEGADIFTQVKTLLADRLVRIGVIEQFKAANTGVVCPR
jgi:hypothetical protein